MLLTYYLIKDVKNSHGVPENRTSPHITTHHRTSTAHHQFMGITVPHSTCISLPAHVLFVSLIVVYSVGL